MRSGVVECSFDVHSTWPATTHCALSDEDVEGSTERIRSQLTSATAAASSPSSPVSPHRYQELKPVAFTPVCSRRLWYWYASLRYDTKKEFSVDLKAE